VEDFSFQGMTFKFHPRRNEDAAKLGPASDNKVDETTNVESNFSEESRDQARMFDEENLLEAEEAQLLIDDPLAFERVQMDRHIEKARMSNEKT
jgi:hypothetical protein